MGRLVARPSARERGYSGAWERARKGYLASHPYCVMHAKMGMRVEATVVDHVQPHRGDKALFWDKSNWQPLCKAHHDSTKQMQENGRIVRLIGPDGWPID
jgi:5-methylcytosine-specific restriction protein A